MHEISYVYILSSAFKRLYIGVTTEIEHRILQHQNNAYPDSFTARYNIKNLVYLERFADLPTAITREKQLKRWSRVKKVSLIVSQNPTWRDLSADWHKPIAPFKEEDLKPPTTFPKA